MIVRKPPLGERAWASHTYWIYDPEPISDAYIVTSYSTGRYQIKPDLHPYDLLYGEIKTSVETVIHEEQSVKHLLSIEFTAGLGPITVYYRIYRQLYFIDRR